VAWLLTYVPSLRPSLLLPAVLLPGYKLAATAPGSEPSAQDALSLTNQSLDEPPPAVVVCPIGFYYDGESKNMACVRCPLGSTTLRNASTSISDCMVRPGWFVAAAANGAGQMLKCPTTPEGSEQQGYYRPGWKSFSEVTSSSGDGRDVCSKCGDCILSRAMDADESPNAAADSKVAASAASCCEWNPLLLLCSLLACFLCIHFSLLCMRHSMLNIC
jgi:hypothetical protein